MKTFQEAVKKTVMNTPWEDRSIAQARKDFKELQLKYLSIAEEAEELFNSGLLAALVNSACEKGLRDAFFTAFIDGLVTGIEMEKP